MLSRFPQGDDSPSGEPFSTVLPRAWIGYIVAVAVLMVWMCEVAMLIALGFEPGEVGIVPSVLPALVTLGGWTYWLHCVYRMHQVIAKASKSSHPITPGKAVGYHFIPFYNLYWVFKWPNEIANFVNGRWSSKQMAKGWAGLFLLVGSLLGSRIHSVADSMVGLAIIFSVGVYLTHKVGRAIEFGLPLSEEGTTSSIHPAPAWPHSGFGIASFIISLVMIVAEFFLAVIAEVLVVMTSSEIIEAFPVGAVLGLFKCGGFSISLVGVAFGIVGILQKERKKLFPILGAAFSIMVAPLALLPTIAGRPLHCEVLEREGVALYQQAQYPEALDKFQTALACYQNASTGDQAKEGTILVVIGKVYADQGRYTEALKMFQQALVILREAGDRVWEGTTLNNIGAVYERQGRYTEALEAHQQALDIQREVRDRAGEGTTLGNIAGVYANQSRYAKAMETFQQALIICREEDNRSVEAGILNNIGSVYAAQGRYDEALENFEQALVIDREVGRPAWEGGSLNNIGYVYRFQGRYDEALTHFQQALTISQQVGDPVQEAATLNNIGEIYRVLGHHSEALDSFEQALLIAREVDHRIGEGGALSNIGVVYHDQGRYTEALEMYRQALVIIREVGNRAWEGAALDNIGIVHQTQGRYAEASAAYQQAMDTLEAVRAAAGSEQGRAGFIAQYADLYTRAASLFHQQGQDEEAFFTSERGRARAFLDSLATGQVALRDNEAAAFLVQWQEAYTGRQAAHDALARARALDPSTGSGQAPPDPTLVADLEAQLAEAETTHSQALADIEARGDQLAALVPSRHTVLGLSEVQALLDEQTTLLSYFILKDQTLAFLITRTGFEVVAIEVSRQELADRVSYFRDVIPFRQPEAAQPAAQELYQLLIAPLSSSLRTSRLMIVPHGPLHYLPFAALVGSDTGQTLLERYTLITLPSASALPFIQQNRNPPADSEPAEGAVLALGNPATGDADLSSLTFAEQEVQTIADLYQVQPLLGESATESAVGKHASQARVLHLAAHGSYNSHNPLYSAIALAPDAANDGRLEVHEIYGLDLTQVDLVVLSACQTHLGQLSAGDELVGLTRAFVFAGAPTVVATLWSVDDEATALLMESFYTHLRAGMSKAEALRQAQLEVQETHPEPYYWAGFVLSGDGG